MYQTQCQAHELTRAKKLREQKCRKNYYGNSYYNSFRFVRVKEDLAEAKSKESQKLVVLTQQKLMAEYRGLMLIEEATPSDQVDQLAISW